MGEAPIVAPGDGPRKSENLTTGSAEVVGSPNDLEEVEIPDQAPGPRFSQEEHRAEATKLLALLLFAALIACFVAHFVTIWYFIHDKQALDEFNQAFNIWIPVLSGLFGSAATFYFTQGRK